MLGTESNEYIRKLTALYDIINEISKKKNLSAAADALLNLIVESLSSSSGSIHLFSEDKLFLLSNRGKGCVNDDLAILTEEEKKFMTVVLPVELKDVFLYPSIMNCVQKGQFNFEMVMPMISGEYLVGAVFIGKKSTLKGYTKEDKLFLAMTCKQVATIVHNAFLERELVKANNVRSELYIKSITDPLTGLYHRAHLEFRLKEDLKVSKRYKRPFSALMIEIDYFFQISETNGSQLTYHLLQGVAKTIEKAVRIDVDLPSRYSVDTMVVLLPETPPKGAMVLAERIRQKINILHRSMGIENFPQISASIGVASLEDNDEGPEDFMAKLKQALEQAKSSGKNAVFFCHKNTEQPEKTFSTFEKISGINSELLANNLELENELDTENNSVSDAKNAYKTVAFYQKNVSLDWNPEKNYTQIKVSNNNPDDFSYQPMMFLDFIDEEEKQKIKKEEASVKIPEKVVEKVSPVSKSINVNALNNIKKYSNMTPNKYDNNSIKKVQLKHGRIPNKDEQQIHSLGFIDDI
ncbi:MAG: diguanylate cyclase [Candidatus Sericytochromatia bacterium]